MEINQITAAEVKTVLSQIGSNASSSHTNPGISTLLKQVKTVAGTVMGSNQARAKCCVELHAQIFSSGLSSIFITINPCDFTPSISNEISGVDLDIDHLIFDIMPGSQERAAIAASHPVGIARFFNKLIEPILNTLIGYNHQLHQSHPGGGVLGEIEAYYGTVEESGRGALHLHMLLWLVGNVNPSGLRESIKHEVC
ncbi:unnamed protein product [Didymodactylos carnosus]|uniref:Helitron helicase-like domain-containing protein n=1 Tax=Didymodactylos carnosus TaxID=1234261 RepID=A0A8S2UM44_9BILA|nr:unnamed protein product [Didymodactylos carnosus]CAF4351632.1 unnamed protein product [Didymodactylos carnosus]